MYSPNIKLKKKGERDKKCLQSFTYQYKRDKTSNWAKRTDFIDKKATYILERKLAYY